MRKLSIGLTALVSLIAIAPGASADGPLTTGEIVAATGSGIIRIKPDGSGSEVIPASGNQSVAILNGGTIYTVEGETPAGMLRVYAFDLISEQSTLVAEFPGWHADVAIEPSGTLVAVIAKVGGGKVVRIDPAVPMQTPEVIAEETSGPYLIQMGIVMPTIDVASNGDIYVSSPVTGLLLHVTPGNLSDISWDDDMANITFDRRTGEMLSMRSGPDLMKAVPHEAPAWTHVFASRPVGLVFGSAIAQDANGDVLYGTIGGGGLRRASPSDDPPVPTTLYTGGWVTDIAVLLPACSNGLDENHDGQVDFPNDPTCDSPDDFFEVCAVSFGRSAPPTSAVVLAALSLLLLRRRHRGI